MWHICRPATRQCTITYIPVGVCQVLSKSKRKTFCWTIFDLIPFWFQCQRFTSSEWTSQFKTSPALFSNCTGEYLIDSDCLRLTQYNSSILHRGGSKPKVAFLGGLRCFPLGFAIDSNHLRLTQCISTVFNHGDREPEGVFLGDFQRFRRGFSMIPTVRGWPSPIRPISTSA
jgi:hypothetical protein